MAAEYSSSPKFRDIYKYLDKGFVTASFKGKKLRNLKAISEEYVLIKGVLFKVACGTKEQGVSLRLVIPEKYVPMILYQYHDILSGGHHGVQSMYLLSEKSITLII